MQLLAFDKLRVDFCVAGEAPTDGGILKWFLLAARKTITQTSGSLLGYDWSLLISKEAVTVLVLIQATMRSI